MRITLILTVMFIGYCPSIFAQEKNIKAAKLITTQGDSLSIWINRTPDYELAKQLEYAPMNDSGKYITAIPFEIKGFYIADERAEFVSVKNTKPNNTDSVQFVFGKQIYQGNINLYVCQNGEYASDFYYILQDNHQYYTLAQHIYQPDASHIRTVKKFIGILKYVYQDCKEANRYLDQLSFDNESLVNQIKKYETCKYGVSNGREIKPKNNILVVPELNGTLAHSFGKEPFIDAPLSGSLSALIEIKQPWLSKRISLLTGLGVFSLFITNESQAPIVIPKLQLYVLYSLAQTKTKPYFGAGMCLFPLPLFAFQFGINVVPKVKLFTQLETQTFGIKSGKMIHLGLGYRFK